MLLRIILIIIIVLVLHSVILDLIARISALLAQVYWWMVP